MGAGLVGAFAWINNAAGLSEVRLRDRSIHAILFDIQQLFAHEEITADIRRAFAFSEMLLLPSVRREEMKHREVVERVLDFAELEHFRHSPVGGLPFGIQKIVGFDPALALEPAILLLDEPFAGLMHVEASTWCAKSRRQKRTLGSRVPLWYRR